jgi:hypothetical protein
MYRNNVRVLKLSGYLRFTNKPARIKWLFGEFLI